MKNSGFAVLPVVFVFLIGSMFGIKVQSEHHVVKNAPQEEAALAETDK